MDFVDYDNKVQGDSCPWGDQKVDVFDTKSPVKVSQTERSRRLIIINYDKKNRL